MNKIVLEHMPQSSYDCPFCRNMDCIIDGKVCNVFTCDKIIGINNSFHTIREGIYQTENILRSKITQLESMTSFLQNENTITNEDILILQEEIENIMANVLRTSNNGMSITWKRSNDKNNGDKICFTLHGPNDVIGKASMTADQIASYILKNSVLKNAEIPQEENKDAE